MLLAGVAVVLLAWSGGPSLESPRAAIDARDVDIDDSAGIIVTADDADIFGMPLRPFEGPGGAMTAVEPAALRDGVVTGATAGSGGARDPGTRADPVVGTGTSTPTPANPAPTTPGPATGGGSDTSIAPVRIPTPPPAPTPVVDGRVASPPLANVATRITGTGTVALAADVASVGASTTIDAPTASTSTTVDLGVTSATVDTSTHAAAVTAGDITLTVPLAGALLG